jgi:hypothetical protein
VGLGEEDVDADRTCKIVMAGHLGSLVPVSVLRASIGTRSISSMQQARTLVASCPSGRSPIKLNRLAWSISVTMAERPFSPIMRSPSKWPTSLRSQAISGRSPIKVNRPSGLDFFSEVSPARHRRLRRRLCGAGSATAAARPRDPRP